MPAPAEQTIIVRPMIADDAEAVLRFARALPVHDQLFLRRDIRNARVVEAWADKNAQGLIRTLVAVDGDRIVGCVALVRDALSWSPHVVELRVLVAPEIRGAGFGRKLAEEGFALALADGAEKVVVHLVPDQQAAVALFEEMGFRAEAMLRDHVRDAAGETHDLAILSLDVLRQGGQHSAYGL
ncbi:GNAT family N-acetyltransferase [Sphingomonas sp. 1P06PA]|uniref:GNAT family N-acetyltransferase n=1 Tax=Sphingomonas sp. 1P06PA TaxID=554121 RepID=UPI0039A67ABC